jgi:predicted ArsR family transcriptional regulator
LVIFGSSVKSNGVARGIASVNWRYSPPVDERAVAAIACLEDEVRAALYAHVRAAEAPVTREAAADAVGVSRKLAAFHLDKLVAAGLLQARIEAVGPRRVGRAPKVYEPTRTEFEVHVPARSPGMLAEILAEAVVSERDDESAADAVMRVARSRGRELGDGVRTAQRPGRLGAERALSMTAALLEQQGFEPCRGEGTLRLRNCPFHPLAKTQPQLVCGLNRAYLAGILEGLQAEAVVTAELAPREGACCVEMTTRPK